MVLLVGASHMPTEHPGVDQLETVVLGFMQSITRPASIHADVATSGSRGSAARG